MGWGVIFEVKYVWNILFFKDGWLVYFLILFNGFFFEG